jgi:NAD(P)-dependent dehydrogenase (short-subunit alcohol dehydrogenase family)
MAIEDFNGAVAVVTGGASGIGLATARALHAQGAHVALADINEAGLEAAADQVRQVAANASLQVITIKTDVTDDAQTRAMINAARAITGNVNLLVACAGIGRGGPIEDLSSAAMRQMLDVNVMGIYNSVQAVVPVMKEQGGGHITLISSVAGKLGAPALTGYCATKWAVRGFSIALRAELYGTGIGVTTVYPAWVDTPMFQQAVVESEGLTIEIMLKPEQVADAILEAARANARDLTIAPNPDIAMLIQRTHDDPDRAEDSAGRAYYRRLHPQG